MNRINIFINSGLVRKMNIYYIMTYWTFLIIDNYCMPNFNNKTRYLNDDLSSVGSQKKQNPL